MALFTTKIDGVKGGIVLDDMILTKDMPTTAGSKMLDGYMSLFDAEVVARLTAAGYTIAGKAAVGEMAIDLLGETAYQGAEALEGALVGAAAEIVRRGEAVGAVCLEANGSVSRAAAVAGLAMLKPTYGVVSRFGTIPVVCSGECVSTVASNIDTVLKIFSALAHHDDKDGTSHKEELCASALSIKPVRRIAIVKSLVDGIDSEVAARLEARKAELTAAGVEVVELEDSVLDKAHGAWNILMSAELCNNVSRYDGVKYGYRSETFTNIDELYTNSRTEAFGSLLKTAILFGSDALSTDNYMAKYDKALRIRRVVSEAFAKIFAEFDAVLTVVGSKDSYTADMVKENEFISFEENKYVAPMMISGLPYVVAGGVALVGAAFSDGALLECAKIFEGGER